MEEIWREQYFGGEDEDEDMSLSGGVKPWTEVVITFTGLEDKVCRMCEVKLTGLRLN